MMLKPKFGLKNHRKLSSNLIYRANWLKMKATASSHGKCTSVKRIYLTGGQHCERSSIESFIDYLPYGISETKH